MKRKDIGVESLRDGGVGGVDPLPPTSFLDYTSAEG